MGWEARQAGCGKMRRAAGREPSHCPGLRRPPLPAGAAHDASRPNPASPGHGLGSALDPHANVHACPVHSVLLQPRTAQRCLGPSRRPSLPPRRPLAPQGTISPPLLFWGGGRGVLFHHYSAAVCAAGPGPRVTPWTDRRVPAFVLLWSFFFFLPRVILGDQISPEGLHPLCTKRQKRRGWDSAPKAKELFKPPGCNHTAALSGASGAGEPRNSRHSAAAPWSDK